jgi:UPF0716 protein FxsA
VAVFLVGIFVFVVAEISSFVAVAGQIGFLRALAVLLVVSALGPFIVRRVGIGVVAHTQERLARGEVPTRELLDGLVVLVGGFMICVPGFVSDAIGLALMIGPVRHLVIRATGNRLARRIPAMRIQGWRVTDNRSRAVPDDSSTPSNPPGPSLSPAEVVELGPGEVVEK